MWLFCLLDPGHIRYRAIYTHPNQIPGYASGAMELLLYGIIMITVSHYLNCICIQMKKIWHWEPTSAGLNLQYNNRCTMQTR